MTSTQPRPPSSGPRTIRRPLRRARGPGEGRLQISIHTVRGLHRVSPQGQQPRPSLHTCLHGRRQNGKPTRRAPGRKASPGPAGTDHSKIATQPTASAEGQYPGLSPRARRNFLREHSFRSGAGLPVGADVGPGVRRVVPARGARVGRGGH